MKNTEGYSLIKTIGMTLDEFRKLVETLTEGLQTVEYEDGAYLVHTDKAEETDTWINQDMSDILSKHFGCEITSWHSDTVEQDPMVYICYKDKETEVKMDTPIGIITALVESEIDYPGAYITIKPTGYDDEIDLVGVCIKNANNPKDRKLNLYTFGDVLAEDFSHKEIITQPELLNLALSDYNHGDKDWYDATVICEYDEWSVHSLKDGTIIYYEHKEGVDVKEHTYSFLNPSMETNGEPTFMRIKEVYRLEPSEYENLDIGDIERLCPVEFDTCGELDDCSSFVFWKEI